MDLSEHKEDPLPEYSGLSPIDSKPPSFSSYEELMKAPLPDQEKGGMGCPADGSRNQNRRKVLVALLIGTCFCVGVVLLTLFIILSTINWALLFMGPCSSMESAVVGQIEGFYGEGVKRVRIVNNGDVILARQEPPGPKIVTRTTVYAGTKEEALNAPYKLSQGDTHFFLEYPLAIGGCPRQDTEVKLLDAADYGPVSFEAASISGSIVMATPFEELHFTTYLAETAHGDIHLSGAIITSGVKLSTSAGSITVDASTSSPVLEIETDSGDVVLREVQTSKLDVEVDNGNIRVAQLTLQVGIKGCHAELETTTGAVRVENLHLPAAGGCLVEVRSVSGDVDVHLGPGFSGSILIQTTDGEAMLQDSLCDDQVCKVQVKPELESGHVVVVKSFAGKASVTY